MMNLLKLSWLISIVLLAISVYVVQGVPSDLALPIHWGIDGKVDQMGDASLVLYILPATLMVILGILSSLKYIDPRKENISMSAKSIGSFALVFSIFIIMLEGAYIALINGLEINMILTIVLAVSMLFMVMGNYLSKTRSNFFVGIRTPWTLSSEVVWKKTHNLAGKLFMSAGALIAAGCWFVKTEALMPFMLFIVIIVALIPVIYSWRLWQQEQLEKKNFS
jgi:uncharacterized membrane protein